MTTTNYRWTFVFSNDRMGFRKTVLVEAGTYGVAFTSALDVLAEKGYDPTVFEVVEKKRKGDGR